MKPNTFELLATRDFSNLEELQAHLAEFQGIANQHPSTIYVRAIRTYDSESRKLERVKLEAEALSDGSIVYNIDILA